MGFSREEYWSGLPCPPPEDLSDPGIEPGFPALQADSLPLALPGKLLNGFRAYLSVKPTKKTLAPQSPQGLFFHYNLWCTKTDAKAETPILWPPHVKS